MRQSRQRVIDVGDLLPRRGNKLSAWCGTQLLWLLGWRVTGNLPNLPKAVVIGAPHTSNRDGLVGAAAILALRLRIYVMVKASLFRGPFGGLLRFLGALPVNRQATTGLVDASVQQFKDHEALLLGIAPEGTRHRATKWKNGFYHIAHSAGVPIIVVVLDYANKEVRLPLVLWPSGDLEADMPRIMDCYYGVLPARPERLSEPLRD